MKIKENISLVDTINAIEYITESYFKEGEYTPYYANIAQIIAVVTYFVDDLELNEDEDLYAYYLDSEELQDLVRRFTTEQDDNQTEYELFQYVMANVYDKVDFLKQKTMHQTAALDKIGNLCDMISHIVNINQEDIDVAMDVMKKLQEKGVTKDSFVEVIKEAADFKLDDASVEIIDAKNKQLRDKNEKIAELKKYKSLWDARNLHRDK
uniref:Uncharacterized protein n=1 Tax=Siphoviridae sp. ctZd434 TaxID=2825559 RepID=A0A8S5UHC7_9CAUD|nr:MAG TPA: hypothetical protein [Siphoviridae sp. ctZd434]